MASRWNGTPVSFFIYSSPSPQPQEEEEQEQIETGSPKSVIPDLFFSSREQQQQIGSPFTPVNAPKTMNPHLSISADRFQFRVPSTTDDDVVLQNLLHIIRYIINKKKSKSSSSSSLTPAQKLFNSLDLVQKKVTQQLERIKETPTFQMGVRDKKIRTLMSMR
ncbi:hypothetical protein SO802_006305 [Lithocarpus litseifolius]|uniref:Uncharacterized protein n=1 Tax=Lithocarpus litseifolius TaxID=425828 RepID=A0AAW2DKH6_9ROSI